MKLLTKEIYYKYCEIKNVAYFWKECHLDINIHLNYQTQHLPFMIINMTESVDVHFMLSIMYYIVI